MIAILGGLGAAGVWAIATACSSRSSRLIDPASVVAWVMLIGLLVAAPAAALGGIPAGLDGPAGAWLALAGAGNVGGLLLAYFAMRTGQVALVAPLLSTEGAIAALVAVATGEALAPGVATALVVIAAGIVLAALPSAGAHPSLRAESRRAPALALAAAVAFGVSLYAAGRAGATLPSAWVAIAARIVGCTVLTLPLACIRRLVLTRQAVPLLAASGVGEVLGFYSYTAGARHGIAVAAVLSSQFGALAALVGYAVFKERLTRMQVLGVGVVALGVAGLSALRA